ncbi:hypothetical protein J6590_070219 [Homalodisca vitripennis]|nr:hypothetical protein J6590_070219 [Homalodisca vitripennis]
MSYHSVRSSQTGPSSVVSPSKFQLVLQISKSLSSVAALVCPITCCSARMSYHLVRSSQTGPRSVVSPSKFQLVLQISSHCGQLQRSMSYTGTFSQTGPRGVVSPSKFQLVLQISKFRQLQRSYVLSLGTFKSDWH